MNSEIFILLARNERGKLQPDITVEIIIISYFTGVYFKLYSSGLLFGEGITRNADFGSWLMKCPAAFLKSL